jgi:PilZ domain-containing protein
VRHVESDPTGYRVGVMFLGKTPPRGFERNAGGLYFLPGDEPPVTGGRERRRWQRIDIFVNLRLIRLSPQGPGPHEERTIAENISRGGARVLTSMPVGKGEVLMLEELDGGFRTRAEVRNLYIGPDSIPRLNLEFLDAEAPDRLVGPS